MGISTRIFSLSLAFLWGAVCAQPVTQQEREKGWSDDLDYFVQQVKLQHHFYQSHDLPADFNSRAQTLRKKISFIGDEQLLIELEGLAASLGDGHTYVRPWGAEHVVTHGLPFKLYQFPDGIYVTDATTGFTQYIGSRIDMLGALKTDEAVAKIGDYISRDNEMGNLWYSAFLLTFQGALEEIGVETDNDIQGVQVTMTDRAGKKIIAPIAYSKLDSVKGVPVLNPSRITSTPPPLYLTDVSRNYWIKSLRSRSSPVLYIQFNRVVDDPKESIVVFSTRLSDSLKKVRPKNVIVDVRHNGFGNKNLLDPLLETLTIFKKSNPSAKITFITGRNTFSACQFFISKAEKLLHPVFAGERTSSKPNFACEEKVIVLPFSGAVCSISGKYEETFPGDKREWINVDIPIALTAAAYFANQDPVMERILRE